jgi:hypothetical protein
VDIFPRIFPTLLPNQLLQEQISYNVLLFFRASLGTPFFQEISIFPRENELIFLRKMKILLKNGVTKLALKEILFMYFFYLVSDLCRSEHHQRGQLQN